jgi:hypothetical protein
MMHLVKIAQHILKKTINFVFFVVIFLFFLEIASRFYLFGFNSLNYFKINSIHDIESSGLIKPARLEIIYELKPMLEAYFKLARFRTNSQGLPDKEYSINKPSNTFRVVVLGDSFTMSAGVDMEATFHSILEERLNRESSSSKYEFINFGVGGYVPRQNLATLKYKALEYNPDLVLFCIGEVLFAKFDIQEKAYTLPYRVKPRTNPFFESFFIKLLEKNKFVIYFKHKFKSANRNKNDDFIETLISEHIKRLKSVFLELHVISKTRHLPICIILLERSDKNHVFAEILKNSADEFGFFFVDTSPAFKGVKLSKYIIYKLDWHPNAKAHKIFAAVIYDYLKEKYLLVK